MILPPPALGLPVAGVGLVPPAPVSGGSGSGGQFGAFSRGEEGRVERPVAVIQ